MRSDSITKQAMSISCFIFLVWKPNTSVALDVKPRLDKYDCLFEYAETVAADVVASGSEIYGIEAEYYYRYFDKTDSYLAVNDFDNNLYLYSPQTSSSLTSYGDVDKWVDESNCQLVEYSNLKSSYEADHLDSIAPFYLPEANHGWFSAVAFADFTGNGELELITSTSPGAFGDRIFPDGTKYQYGDPGKIQFWRKNFSNSGWSEITNSLIVDNDGCMLARKALVSDFNGDGKPDVFFACTGHNQVSNNDTTTGEFNELDKDALNLELERNLLLLSGEGGLLRRIYPIEYRFNAHGASAGDVNGDGAPDIIHSDEMVWNDGWVEKYDLLRNQSIRIFLNDGAGNFAAKECEDLIPKEICQDSYGFTAMELIDLNGDGFQDIWLGSSGGEDSTGSWLLFNDGFGDFRSGPVSVPEAPGYSSVLDMVYRNGRIYVYSVNVDYSQPHYYWGDALLEVDLESFRSAIVYEHQGFYKSEGECKGVSCAPWNGINSLDSWFPWIVVHDDLIKPLDKQYKVDLMKFDSKDSPL